MNVISNFLPSSRVRLDVQAAGWEEAIEKAGEILEQEGLSTAQYTKSMVDTVKNQGPYIVLAPGFALAHARPSEEVHQTGLSAIRLAQPVSFGHESNDPVELVFALAAADNTQHLQAIKEIGRIFTQPDRKQQLLEAQTAEEFVAVLETQPEKKQPVTKARNAERAGVAQAQAQTSVPADAVASKGKILTVCGNGLGTSLFLKNTLDELLERWGWSKYLVVEATDTISAKGKAKEADAILTSGAIAQALGDLGIPVRVISNFTSLSELDTALRTIYAVD